MHSIWEDITAGFRALRSKPGFYALPILILALGMGGTISLFSFIDAWILQPIEYPNPDRLVFLGVLNKSGGFSDPLSIPDFIDWRRRSKSIETMAGFYVRRKTLTGDHEAERIQTGVASPELFQLLGVNTAIGRTFTRENTAPGKDRVAMITHGMWQNRFNSDSNVIGKIIRLDGEPVEIIGVLPPKFHFTLMGIVNVIVPLSFTQAQLENRNNATLRVIGKLRPGATLQQARAELSSITSQLAKEYPNSNTNRAAYITSLADQFGQQQGNNYLNACFLIDFLVLLIAISNVANLLLSRTVSRQREIALRIALGASKARVIRQLLVENIVMVLLAAAAGTLFGIWCAEWMQSMIPESSRAYLPNFGVVKFEFSSGLFAFLLAILVGIATGLAPSIEGTRLDLNTALKEGSGNSSEPHGRNRLRGLLVSGQVAIALSLLVTTVLVILGIRDFSDSKPGFEINNLLTMQVALSAGDYPKERTNQFFEESMERIKRQNGIVSVTATDSVPYNGVGGVVYRVAGQPEPRPGEVPRAAHFAVAPNYFETLGIPLLEGRSFTSQDSPDAPKRVIVNDVIVRVRFDNASPIGKKLIWGQTPGEYEIVGVARTITRDIWTPSATDEQLYVPFAQDSSRQAFIIARTSQEPLKLADIVRKQLAAIDPGQPVFGISTLETFRLERSAPFRIITKMLIAAGLLAFLLSIVGIYAVVSYSVSRRMREMGIRSAIGASRFELIQMVVRQGIRLAIPGLVCGLFLAITLVRFIKSMITQVQTENPFVYLVAILALAAATTAASLIPAMRAARVDPLQALRHE